MFLYAHAIAVLGGITVILTHARLVEGYDYLNTIANFVTKFGVCISYQGIFLIIEVFPLIFYSTVFGLCNMLGITSNILAIEVFVFIEDQVLVYIMMVIMSVIALILSQKIVEDS